MIVATVIRAFGENGNAQHLQHVLELLAEPTRGRFLRLPDGAELQIARVTLLSRLPLASEPRFTPGWKLAESVRVLLEPERSRDDAGGAGSGLEGHELLTHVQPDCAAATAVRSNVLPCPIACC